MPMQMTETETEAVTRWNEYQERKAPMLVLETPSNLPDREFHRAFLVVPAVEKDFVMIDAPTKEDAEMWCSERGLPVVNS